MITIEFLKNLNFKNYVPIRTSMYEHKLRTRAEREPSFIICFKRNLTIDFYEEMLDLEKKEINKHVTNTILQVAGLSGTGKSIAVLSLAKLICSSFKQENIFFFDNEILENIKNLPFNTFAIRDENPNRSVFGTGSSRTGFQIETIADTCRKRGLSLIFVEPRFALNGVCKWYLETIDFGSIDGVRVVRMALREPTTLLFIGSIFIPIVDEDDYDWVAYNDRKDSFMGGVIDGTYKGAKMDYMDEAELILNEIDETLYRTKKEKMFYITQKYPNLTSGELKNIMIAVNIRTQKLKMEATKQLEEKAKAEEEKKTKQKSKDKKKVLNKKKVIKNKNQSSLSSF